MPINDYKTFASVVHSVQAVDLKAQNAFVSVVHSVQAVDLKAQNVFVSVVHSVQAIDLKAQNVFTSVVHELPVILTDGTLVQGEVLLQDTQFQGWTLTRGPGQIQ